ncbi:hypothetical protein PR048_012777 [Dryococelus australis]|uniref:Uncharacterized protein n=1 Tax=Dryococelus australis TaxID=614101 RepID=A0ABQ9HQK6_9NEOP|nr:hypothetical protein PR048_012777 [Dryococelus australis]
MKGGANWRSPRKSAIQRHRPGTIPICKNLGATPQPNLIHVGESYCICLVVDNNVLSELFTSSLLKASVLQSDAVTHFMEAMVGISNVVKDIKSVVIYFAPMPSLTTNTASRACENVVHVVTLTPTSPPSTRASTPVCRARMTSSVSRGFLTGGGNAPPSRKLLVTTMCEMSITGTSYLPSMHNSLCHVSWQQEAQKDGEGGGDSPIISPLPAACTTLSKDGLGFSVMSQVGHQLATGGKEGGELSEENKLKIVYTGDVGGSSIETCGWCFKSLNHLRDLALLHWEDLNQLSHQIKRINLLIIAET